MHEHARAVHRRVARLAAGRQPRRLQRVVDELAGQGASLHVPWSRQGVLVGRRRLGHANRRRVDDHLGLGHLLLGGHRDSGAGLLDDLKRTCFAPREDGDVGVGPRSRERNRPGRSPSAEHHHALAAELELPLVLDGREEPSAVGGVARQRAVLLGHDAVERAELPHRLAASVHGRHHGVLERHGDRASSHLRLRQPVQDLWQLRHGGLAAHRAPREAELAERRLVDHRRERVRDG